MHSVRRKLRCKECDQSRRDTAKSANRYLVKARGAFNRHAVKFISAGIIRTREELREKYGWKIEDMAHDMEHAFANSCIQCRRLFSSMPNGLQSIVIDILWPKQPPYYRVNCRWICQTCNSGKRDMDPTDYARHQQFREVAARLREARAQDPYGGTLLEGLKQSLKIE